MLMLSAAAESSAKKAVLAQSFNRLEPKAGSAAWPPRLLGMGWAAPCRRATAQGAPCRWHHATSPGWDQAGRPPGVALAGYAPPGAKKSTALRCWGRRGRELRLRCLRPLRLGWCRGCSCRAFWQCRCRGPGAVFRGRR